MSLTRLFTIGLSIVFACLLLYIPAYNLANRSYIAFDYDFYYAQKALRSMDALRDLPTNQWIKDRKVSPVNQEAYQEIWMRIKLRRGLTGHFLLEADDQAVVHADLYSDSAPILDRPAAITGQAVPSEKRTFKSSWPILPLELKDASDSIYYVRIETPIHLPFTFRLIENSSFQGLTINSLIFTGFFLGGVLIMLAHALFYFFMTKQNIFGWYSFYIVCVLTFYALYSNSNQMLLDFLELSPTGTLRSLAAGILILGIHNYGIRFLELQPHRFYRPYHILQISFIGVTLFADLLPPFYALVVAAVMTSLFIINFVVMFLVAGRFHKNANIFLYAFVFLFVGGVVTIVDKIGISERTPLLSNQVYLSFLVELMLFSLYLGARFNEERLQKVQAFDKIDQMNHNQLQAKAVQKALIASSVSLPSISLKTTYRPAETIGGDLVCFVEDKKRDIFHLFIGDVSGHGISAALMSSNVIGIIKSDLSSSLPPLGDIPHRLVALNKKINSLLISSGTDHSLTLFSMAIDMNSGEAVYVNAGHVFPLIMKGGSLSTLTQRGTILGLDDDPKLTAAPISIDEGTVFMFYTDGLVENEGKNHEKFRIRQMRSITDTTSLDMIMNYIDERTHQLWGEHERRDDYTVVLLRVDQLKKYRMIA